MYMYHAHLYDEVSRATSYNAAEQDHPSSRLCSEGIRYQVSGGLRLVRYAALMLERR
jgi:hypothetical protein